MLKALTWTFSLDVSEPTALRNTTLPVEMLLIPRIQPDKVLIDKSIMVSFQTIFDRESHTLSFNETDAITASYQRPSNNTLRHLSIAFMTDMQPFPVRVTTILYITRIHETIVVAFHSSQPLLETTLTIV